MQRKLGVVYGLRGNDYPYHGRSSLSNMCKGDLKMKLVSV